MNHSHISQSIQIQILAISATALTSHINYGAKSHPVESASRELMARDTHVRSKLKESQHGHLIIPRVPGARTVTSHRRANWPLNQLHKKISLLLFINQKPQERCGDLRGPIAVWLSFFLHRRDHVTSLEFISLIRRFYSDGAR